jgi:adenylate cyclase class IV
MQGRQLDCKFHCEELDALSAHLARNGATLRKISDDVDHYYDVPSGSLKVRVTRPADMPDSTPKAGLIAYTRHTAEVGANCGYIVIDVPEPVEMLAALSLVLRSAGTVSKTREAWQWDSSRIHLDKVAEIGGFVECETPIIDGDEVSALKQQDDAIGLVGSFVGTSEAMSYIDMVTYRQTHAQWRS